MLRMLKSEGVKPICVFDGYHLKAKKATEEERVAYKQKNREQGMTAEQNGDQDEARKHFSRSLVLRTRMIDIFMDILNELEIEFVVAPYEADAQMSYMVKTGQAHFAITEDSDLIAYGCPNIVLKLNVIGWCQHFTFEGFYSFDAKDSKEIKAFQALDKDQFVLACIMAGCEYLPNIERVGLKLALKHFEKYGSFDKVIEFLQSQKTFKDRIPPNYIADAKKVAELFKNQTVYDVKTRKLTQLSGEIDRYDLDYLGPHDEFEGILDQFVRGNLVRATKELRISYMGQKVIDMSKIRMDFARNEVDNRTLRVLNRELLTDKTKPERSEQADGEDFGELGQ